MNDPPEIPRVPPIFQDAGLRVVEIGQREGRPYLLLEARSGRVRRLVVYLQSSHEGHWMYGYEVYDRKTKTRITYLGDHGDPALDRVSDLDGLPGFDDE